MNLWPGLVRIGGFSRGEEEKGTDGAGCAGGAKNEESPESRVVESGEGSLPEIE